MSYVGKQASSKDATIKANVAFMYGRRPAEAAHDPDKRSFAKSVRSIHEDSDTIRSFTGEFDFLSPTFLSPVEYKNELFPTFQHALEASKLPSFTSPSNKVLLEELRNTRNIREVRKLLSDIDTSDWKGRCESIAEIITRDKFMRHKDLRSRLMATKSRQFLYTNTYGDVVWGVSPEGKGANKLGLILEKIRKEIAEGDDLELWCRAKFSFVDADSLRIQVTIMKEGVAIEPARSFEHKNLLYFGKDETLNDVVASHASVSRCHCLIAIDALLGPVLIDLRSSNKTLLNNVPLEPFTSYPLAASDSIQLGASTRLYSVTVVRSAAEDRKEALYEKLGDPALLQVDVAQCTVYVGNLPYEATTQDIRTFFEACGIIQDIKLPVVAGNSRSKDVSTYVPQHDEASEYLQPKHRGFAFVVFTKPAEAERAIRRDGDLLLERKIRVRKSENTETSHGTTGAKRPRDA